MRLVTVGTGTVVPDPDRASACHWIESADTTLLADCGAGALQGMARKALPWGQLAHLFITHFHADHIGEIPALIFAMRHGLAVPRHAPLHVWGPTGTRRLFDRWSTTLGAWLQAPGFDLTLHELRPGETAEAGDVRVAVGKTYHTDESIALRFEAAGSTLGYTGDTGPAEGLAEFFKGADLLLAECSLPDERVEENHLSPGRLAGLAAAARAHRLVVTHVYPQLQGSDVPAQIRAAGYDGEIVMARDGDEFSL